MTLTLVYGVCDSEVIIIIIYSWLSERSYLGTLFNLIIIIVCVRVDPYSCGGEIVDWYYGRVASIAVLVVV